MMLTFCIFLTLLKTGLSDPPLVQLRPNDSVYKVIEGNANLILECVVTNISPFPTQNSFVWFYQGSPIPGQTSSSYIIPKIQRSNDGWYRCSASNVNGTGNSQSMKLDVQYGPGVSLPNSTEIEEGNTLQVTCTVSANPTPVVVWVKPDMTENVSSNLMLPSISRYQEGIYTCMASNTLNPTGQPPLNRTASSTLNVTIMYGPGNSTKVQTVNGSSTFEAAVNQRAADILCNASCKPRCSYKWYKNSLTMNNTDTLSLGIVHRSSEGSYTCEAYNTILRSVTKRSTVSIYVRVKYAPVVKVSAGYNADIIVLKLGQKNVVLNCVVIEAYPQPSSFIWTQDGAELQRDRRSNYPITEVTRQTNGTWGCTGDNTYGTPIEDYMDIVVQYGPVVNIAKSRTLREGESLTVECVVDANPSAFIVSWRKDNDDTFYRNETVLRFDSVRRHDSGTYVCTAMNKILPTGQVEELMNGTSWFYLDVKFEETSLIGAVVGGTFAAIAVLVLLAVALVLMKRKGYSLRSLIKLGAFSSPRQNPGSESSFPSSENRSSLSQRTDPIYENTTITIQEQDNRGGDYTSTIQERDNMGGDYVSLQFRRGKSSSYLKLKDVNADNNGDTNARQSHGDAYDNQDVYVNYEGQADSFQHPDFHLEDDQELYANQPKRAGKTRITNVEKI